MKNFLFVVLFGFIVSSTYEIQIKLDDYQGIRQGSTKVSYNGENAGKVKSITEDDQGGYLVTLKIYDTFEINEDMLFKVENRKLVVDLDGMESKKKKKAEEEKARQLKAAEEEKARQLKVEKEKMAAEQEKARQLKAAEEEKARQLKAAEQEKARQLKAAEEEKARQLKAEEDKKVTKKEKVEIDPVMAEVKDEDADKKSSSTKKLTDRELLKEQYDTPPKLKRRLKISAKKYKNNDPVTLKFLINKKGYVEEVSIKNSSGNSKFDAAAKKAIKKSKWHPAKKHDISIAAWHELEISF